MRLLTNHHGDANLRIAQFARLAPTAELAQLNRLESSARIAA